MSSPGESITARLFGSLQPRDRKLLLACLGIVACFIVLVALIAPQEDDDSVVPSSFSAASRGAEAAFLMLERSGYRVERSEQPLDQLAARADSHIGEHTVLILAQPKAAATKAQQAAVQTVLDHGGRVLATGLNGASLLPDSHASSNVEAIQGGCDGLPDGLDPLAGSGTIHMRPAAEWLPLPQQRAAYTCNGKSIVVAYRAGKGTVVWWADSQPLENASLARDGDLALLLNSLGPPENAHIVWDESLHAEPPALWSYASGTPVHLLWAQLALAAALLLLSFSRRSGPLLPDPVLARDAPLEFVHSLGALYEKAGATNTAVKVAYDRLRLLLGRPAPTRQSSVEDRAREIANLLRARLGDNSPELDANILVCEDTADVLRPMPAPAALSLVRSLWDYERRIRAGRTT